VRLQGLIFQEKHAAAGDGCRFALFPVGCGKLLGEVKNQGL
jgi:hypothetical protein